MKASEMMKRALEKSGTVKIKLLGDSITHGACGTGYEQKGEVVVPGWRRNPDGYCWANLFRDHMEKSYDCKVVNDGCSGIHIQFLLEHLDEYVETDDDLIICTIGTNNRHRFFNDGDKPEREAFYNEFYEMLVTLKTRLDEKGKSVIYVANIPASHANDHNDGENYWRILRMKDIDTAHKRLEKEHGVTLISLYDLFLQRCERDGVFYETLLADGLHPNDEGYRVMYEILKESLDV